jgi:hypothetical protein
MVKVLITNLPPNGGQPITSVQARWNEGTPVALPSPLPGTYDIAALEGDQVQIRAVNAVGDGPWSAPKFLAPGAISLSREVSKGIPSFTIDFNVSNPLPEGVTATYEVITIPPLGAQFVGSQLTVFFDDALPGLYAFRRTRSDGVVEDINFLLDVVQPVITVVEEAEDVFYARINFGADDPPETVYRLTPTDPGPEGGPAGPLDDLDIDTTRAALNALIGADPPRVAFTRAPVIARATGSGPLAVGDVAETVSDGTWVQPDAPLVPVTPQWVITDEADTHTVIPDESGPSVTLPATPGLILRRRLIDGTGLVWSNPLDIAAVSLTPAQRIHAEGDGENGALTSHTRNLNFANALIGDWAYFCISNAEGLRPHTVTVQGNAATLLFSEEALTGWGRAWSYRYQFTANGTSSTPFAFSNFSGTNASANLRLAAFVLRGGLHTGTPAKGFFGSTVGLNDYAATITPTAADSYILAARLANSGMGTPGGWTNATGISDPYFNNIAIAEVPAAPATARTITSISPTSGRLGTLMLIAIPPA